MGVLGGLFEHIRKKTVLVKRARFKELSQGFAGA